MSNNGIMEDRPLPRAEQSFRYVNRLLSSLFVFPWLTACALFFSIAGYAQPTINQPGTMMDIRTQDLENTAIQSNWLSYHGDYSGRRYTSLQQVTRDNVSQLQLQWVFHSRNVNLAGAAPVVVGGVMYVATLNDTFAIDARTGAVLWHAARQSSASASSADGEAMRASRGIAVLGSRLYVVTDDAHLLCLDARSGGLVWDVQYAGGTPDNGPPSAPLVVQDKIIVGVSGGTQGASSFIAAFGATDGKEVWRFRTDAVASDTSLPDEPDSSHRSCGSAVWMQGTYDPDRHAIYWATGHFTVARGVGERPSVDQDTPCLLALDAESGKLKWSSRFASPGQCGDDAPQVPVLISMKYEGAPRAVIASASRSGLPHLFDRETGKLLSAPGKPCQHNAETESWFAPSYSERTHLFYFESAQISSVHAAGNRSSSSEASPQLPRDKEAAAASGGDVLIAYDPETKTIAWKGPRTKANPAPSGLLTTSAGVLFFDDASPFFKAADAASGKLLWQFNMGQNPSSAPIGYAIGEKQYFVVAAGMNLFAFGLP
jgi:alcohol dehydrogenase (cytochrome c)